jgi:hypothetical protein
MCRQSRICPFQAKPDEGSFAVCRLFLVITQAIMICGVILVRDCVSFGLPGYVRIVLRILPECCRLVVGIKEIMDAGHQA